MIYSHIFIFTIKLDFLVLSRVSYTPQSFDWGVDYIYVLTNCSREEEEVLRQVMELSLKEQ